MRTINKSQSILIDFIRGISAQMVLVGHLIGFYCLDQTIFIQNFGVVVFFVLSGHLITISALRLHNDGVFNFKKFFIDRFSRIYAGLLPAIIICIIIDYFTISIIPKNSLIIDINNLNLKSTIATIFNLGGMPNPISFGEIIQPVGSMRPLWSVALEWWIYLFVGISFLFVRNMHRVAFLFLSIGLFSIISQIIINNYAISFFIISAWFIASSLILLDKKLPFNKITLLISIALFILLISKNNIVHFYEPIYMILFIIIYFSSLEAVKTLKINNIFARISNLLSRFSYSLYLLHYTLIVLFKPLLKTSNTNESFIIFIICNLTAFVFYNIFESKFVIIRNFLIKKF